MKAINFIFDYLNFKPNDINFMHVRRQTVFSPELIGKKPLTDKENQAE
jgi:hypothetical protein